jgi:5-methylthioadenosine/S-adenosylhomocysteine deaminase
VVGETIIGFPVADAKTPADALARTEALIREFAGDDLITAAPAPHSPYTVDEATLRAVRRLADRYRTPILIHVAETEDETNVIRAKHQATPTAWLESLGFLGPDVVAAHGVWLTGDDIAIFKRTGAAVSHNPESNMKLASGVAPIPKCLAAGVTVGLGTDGAASNNDLDMFGAMRQAAFLHKLASKDPTAIPAAAAVEMATLGGARALGLEKAIGSIEVGKRADLIVVAMDGARQTPMYNPVSHLVYVTRGADVRTTIVNGKVLMRDRRMRTLDESVVLADARALARTVRQAVAPTR